MCTRRIVVPGLLWLLLGPALARGEGEPLPRYRVLHEVEGMSNHVYALALGPAGEVAVGDCDGLLRVLAPDARSWRLTVQPAAEGHQRCLFSGAVRFDQAGERLFAGDKEGRLQVFGSERGELRHAVAAHRGAVMGLALAPDAASLVTAGKDGRVLRWDLAQLTSSVVAARDRSIVSIAFTSSGNLALGEGATLEGSRLAVLDPRGALRAERLIPEAFVSDVAPGPRGTLLVSTSRGEVLVFPSDALGEPLRVLPRPAPRALANGIALHPGGRICAVAYRVRPRGLLVLWDLERGEELQRFELFFHVVDAALWSREGSRLVVCGASSSLAVLGPDP